MKYLIIFLRLLSYSMFFLFLLVIYALSKGFEHKELLFGIVVAYFILIQAIDYAKEVEKKHSHKKKKAENTR